MKTILTLPLLALACSGASHPKNQLAKEARFFVGVWTTSTTSYDDAAKSEQAVRLAADGTMIEGTWTGGAFTAQPVAGETKGFVERWDIDPAAKTIHYALNGADESAPYTIEGPDRWKTVADDTTVYHVHPAP